MSGENIANRVIGELGEGQYGVTLLTERRIKDEIINRVDALGRGDQVDIHMFYFSDRGIVNSLKRATQRGVEVNLILDANKDAFGIEKNGIPNRQVGYELMRAGSNVRWYLTRGEQFHSKLLIFQSGDEVTIIGGSANLTRRNLNNLNLETNVMVRAQKDSELAQQVLEYADKIFNNIGGVYTLDFEEYEERSVLKWIVYWIQEVTGLSTF
jgi:phosphatidylserine/phosphatidylglycerophosphate/cardiolipin synthase-like enzyme